MEYAQPVTVLRIEQDEDRELWWATETIPSMADTGDSGCQYGKRLVLRLDAAKRLQHNHVAVDVPHPFKATQLDDPTFDELVMKPMRLAIKALFDA